MQLLTIGQYLLLPSIHLLSRRAFALTAGKRMSSSPMSNAKGSLALGNTEESASGSSGVCRPCSGMDESDLLDVDAVRKRVPKTMPLWRVGTREEEGFLYGYIHRSFVAKSFQAALDAINDMGAIAERESHHPNFHLINYREVTVEIWTHKLKGLTENDLTLARSFDQQVRIAYSPKWLSQHPEAKGTAKSE
jgi:4a-hydroxytetrahydrobiopterin dehydratase